MPPRAARSYQGPECPRCRARLTSSWIHTGTITCPDCSATFEAVAFEAPAPKLRVLEVAAAATDGGANACANHARNAAVTNCHRCGLFICALCEMSVGGGSLCPGCFDRVRADESSGLTRYRDYVAMARVAMLAGIGFFFLGAPFGVAAFYYARKGRAQRRAEGRSTVWPGIMMAVGLIEALGGALMLAFLLWTVFKAVPQTR